MKKLILVFLSVYLVACDDDLVVNTDTNSYLPLQVGNEWKFVPTTGGTGEQYTFKRVISTVIRDNHEYAQVISGYSIATEVTTDTTYYRIGANGFVYFRKGNNEEENVFRLNGADGDSWNYELKNDYKVSINLKITTLQLDGKDLTDCKGYYYDVNMIADEENTTTLAKEIGFVKLYSDAWGSGSILKSAIINGHQLNF
jgi:hypothetical protein